MEYTLHTSNLSIKVTKIGIELSSIKSKVTGKEYIWQADPIIWGSQAPVLFPIIGALINGETYYKGNKYNIPKHGLVRNSSKVKLIEQTDDSLKFSLKWDEDSLNIYPFKFEFEVSYSIIGKTVQVTHFITNHGEEPMLYSVGGHPAFNCPIQNDEMYEDYYLEFEKEETDSVWLLDSNALTTGETRLMLEKTQILPLHKNIFDNDALIFKNLKSRKVKLKSVRSGEILSMSFEDFNYLGIWAKPGAPFVCIEPWLGITDHSNSDQNFETKEGIIELGFGQSERKTYSITILD